MKNLRLLPLMMGMLTILAACNENAKQTTSETLPVAEPVLSTATEDVKDRSFSELFKKADPTQLTDNVFKLVGSDYTVITAGPGSDYNSMVASFGGWGILFSKPTTWCILRANRYTLEMIKSEQTYTMTYFEEMHKEEFIKFGMKSGRDSDKMKESQLTPIATPSGNTTYKEARLIIECKLTELTTVSPDDFYTEEGKEFITGAYEEAKDYHKLVFGEITDVWVRK